MKHVSGATSVRPTFRDQGLDERYEAEGYVVIPGIARDALRALRNVHRRLIGSPPPGFHSTMYSTSSDLKREVHRKVVDALGPSIDRALTGYRPLLGNFVTKGSGPTSAMSPHQDWTFVDEPELTSMNFWVPLTNVSRRNGALYVLPRSHRVPLTIRGSGTDDPFAAIGGLVASRMVEVPMRAGDALIHDHRMVHSSPPNTRRRPRLAVACALVPAHSQVVHYSASPNALTLHHLEDRFFTDYTFGENEFPPSAQLVGPVGFHNPQLTAGDLPDCRPRGGGSE